MADCRDYDPTSYLPYGTRTTQEFYQSTPIRTDRLDPNLAALWFADGPFAENPLTDIRVKVRVKSETLGVDPARGLGLWINNGTGYTPVGEFFYGGDPA